MTPGQGIMKPLVYNIVYIYTHILYIYTHYIYLVSYIHMKPYDGILMVSVWNHWAVPTHIGDIDISNLDQKRPTSESTNILATYNDSLTWNVGPFWDDSPKKTHDSRVRENSEVVIIYPKASYPTDSETKSTRFPQFLQLHLRLVWRLMAYSLEIKKKQRTWPVFFLGFTSWFCRIYDGYLPVVSHFASWKPEGN